MVVLKEPEKLKHDITTGIFSMNYVARLIGCTRAFICSIIKGTRNPNPMIAVGICEVLNKQFEDYFFISNVDKTKTRRRKNDRNKP